MAQGPQWWSRPVMPPPSRLPLPRTPGWVRPGPLALPVVGAPGIRPLTPSPPPGDPRGLSPLEGRRPCRLQQCGGRSSRPPVLGTPRGPLTPLGPSTPLGSRSPHRQGGSRRSPPPARQASVRCLPHPLSPRPKSRESRAGQPPPSRLHGGSWQRFLGLRLPRSLRLFVLVNIFCSSFRARFLARISLSSGIGGRESVTIPIPCKTSRIRD